ncbi:MAG: hypothetical protein U0822_23470 [Anaerolineae bacterium]
MVNLNSAVAYLALGVTLLLGLYLVTRSPRRATAWLAAGTLWALSGYFLNRLINLNLTTYGRVATLGAISAIWAAPLFFNLATRLRGGRRAWRIPIWAAYGIVAVFSILVLQTDLVFQGRGNLPALQGQDTVAGPLYAVLGAYLLACGALGVWLMWQAQRTAAPGVRARLRPVFLSSLVAIVGVAYLVGISLLALPAVVLGGDVLLAVAVTGVGYGVARYNALLEGRATGSDLRYLALAVSLVVLVYLVVTWVFFGLYGISLAAFIPVFITVIISHTLYDAFRNQLDRLFFQRNAARLRESLRTLAREAGEGEALGPALRDTLAATCAEFSANSGLVALRDPQGLRVAASLRLPSAGALLPDFDIPDDASRLTAPLSGLDASSSESLAAIAPLSSVGETLGFIAIGARAGGYTDAELASLADVADRIANVVYAARAADKASADLHSQLDAYRDQQRDLERRVQELTAPAPALELSQAALVRQVEDALRHIYDFPYLGEHRLARLRAVGAVLPDSTGSVTLLERGQALRDVLIRAVERLRPPGSEPKGDDAAGRREWHAYLILWESYVDDIPNRTTMNRLLLSEGSYNRLRRQALRGVARALEDEEAALSAQIA